MRLSGYDEVKDVRSRASYVLLISLGPLDGLNVLICCAINRCKAQ